MHPAAFEYVRAATKHLVSRHVSVLEFGSYNVNGTVRVLLPKATWLGIDPRPGPCVDVVADAATFDISERFDLIICCEAFEHCAGWPSLIANAFRLLKNDGIFVGTAANLLRAPHTCDGGPMPNPPTEYYANIDAEDLKKKLADWFQQVTVDELADDVRWCCRKTVGKKTPEWNPHNRHWTWYKETGPTNHLSYVPSSVFERLGNYALRGSDFKSYNDREAAEAALAAAELPNAK